MQPIESIEEFQELQRVDLSDHEPAFIADDEEQDALEAIDANH